MPGPTENPATNLMMVDVAIRAGSYIARRSLEKGMLRGRYGKDTAREIVQNKTLGQTLARLPEQFFDKHPDWFALIDGERSANSHCAFESANPVALKTFSRRVAEYIEAHPEIDILGLLPPDIVKWSESPEALAQGSPSRRQAIVTEAVRKELKRRNLEVGLETYAYDLSEPFPENIKVHEDIIVTLALFYQTHRGPIYDPESMPEGRTATALHDWTRKRQEQGHDSDADGRPPDEYAIVEARADDRPNFTHAGATSSLVSAFD